VDKKHQDVRAKPPKGKKKIGDAGAGGLDKQSKGKSYHGSLPGKKDRENPTAQQTKHGGTFTMFRVRGGVDGGYPELLPLKKVSARACELGTL